MTRLRSRGLVILLASVAAFSTSVARGQKKPPVKKMKAAAIKVVMVDSNEIKLPAEFQVSLYEDLIQQLQKKGGFHVYREGDRNAENAADLVILQPTVRGFKEGSERLRQVTTVAGATSISVHCAFTDKDGKTVLEQDIKGNVRFFGGNLRATYDFAKKAAQVAHDNFSPTAGA
jgi:hypothetical protein